MIKTKWKKKTTQTSKQSPQFPLTNPKPKKSPENKQPKGLTWEILSHVPSPHIYAVCFYRIFFKIVLVWNNVISSRMKRTTWIAEPRGAVELKGGGAHYLQRYLRWPLCWTCAGDAFKGTSLSWGFGEKLLLPWFLLPTKCYCHTCFVFWLPKGLFWGEATSKSCWQGPSATFKCFFLNSLIILSWLHPGNLWQGSFPQNNLTLGEDNTLLNHDDDDNGCTNVIWHVFRVKINVVFDVVEVEFREDNWFLRWEDVFKVLGSSW